MYVVLAGKDFEIDTPDGVQIALARMHVLGIAAACAWKHGEKNELEHRGYLQLDGSVTDDPGGT